MALTIKFKNEWYNFKYLQQTNKTPKVKEVIDYTLIIIRSLLSIMTYKTQTPNNDNTDADESSSLFLTVADASPSFLLGQDGVATKKNHGGRMIVVVAICFLLGIIAVTHQGNSSSSNIHAPDDTSMLNKDMM